MITLIKRKGRNPQTGETLYFPRWKRISTVTKITLAQILARGAGWTPGAVEGMLTDFPQHIIDQLLAGNAVYIQGLGTFSLKVRGIPQKSIKDVTTQGATIEAVHFEPDKNLLSRLLSEQEFQFMELPEKKEK